MRQFGKVEIPAIRLHHRPQDGRQLRQRELTASLDDRVGTREDRLRQDEADLLRGLEID